MVACAPAISRRERLAWTLLATILAAAAPVPSVYVGHLDLDANRPYVTAAINGELFRLRVDLDAQGSVVLNREAARRTNFQRGGSVTMNIGPVKFTGRFAPATLAMEGRQVPVQVKWFARRAASDADGIISPALLPFESVTLAYDDPVAPSRHLSFITSLEDEAGLHVRVPIGSQVVKVRFSPREQTVATAAAAAVIADLHGAVWDGDQQRAEIGYGVARPVRPLALAKPLPIGQLSVSRLLVRLADFAGRHELPEEGAPAAAPDEILVQARRPTQDAVYRLTLGRGTLAGCYAATVFAAAHDLILDCEEHSVGGDDPKW